MRICLICRRRNIDHYGICPECAELNRKMRETYCDLSGRFSVVTGGRIKIGYAVCLRLLRQGASVIAVTRYPKSALETYMKEPDYEQFKERLYIIGFDLLHVDRIDELISQIESICGNNGLDILINNAAQTVKKSSEYYAALETHEKELCLESSNMLPIPMTGGVLSIADNKLCDYGETENDNSWVRKPEDVSVRELLEVQLINVTAPFLLTSGLRKLMCGDNSKTGNRFIINVSSVEGRFNEKPKLTRHTHTNMAKASLNMMTHSLARDYATDKIFVYSCDPGWVSNQFPPGYEISKSFEPYLTFDDGAARVLYPVTKNLSEEKVTDFGVFYKDYHTIA